MTLPLSLLDSIPQSSNCSPGNIRVGRMCLCRICAKMPMFSARVVCYPAVGRLILGRNKIGFRPPGGVAPDTRSTAAGSQHSWNGVDTTDAHQPDPKKPAEKKRGWNWHHNFQPVGRSGLRVDLTGRTFGMLTVLEYAGPDKFGHSRWTCQCECGRKTTTLGLNLTTGRTGSCRCAMGGRRGVTQRDWLTREKPPAETPFESAPGPPPESKGRRDPLHPSDIVAIREQHARGYSQGVIARRFEVTQATVSLILKGKLHKDVV